MGREGALVRWVWEQTIIGERAGEWACLCAFVRGARGGRRPPTTRVGRRLAQGEERAKGRRESPAMRGRPVPLIRAPGPSTRAGRQASWEEGGRRTDEGGRTGQRDVRRA